MNSEIKTITSIGIITLLVIVAGLYFSGGSSTNVPATNIQPNILVREDSPRIVAKQAKIQIVEFADFQCPACAVQAPYIRQLLDKYKDQVDYVFRIIPIHNYSKDAAAAAYAAGEQGKFFEMGDVLFAKQDEWSTDKSKLTEYFISYATQIGLNVEKFKTDIVNNRAAYDARVDIDAKDAVAMSISSTPTMIVNGKESFRGVLTFEKLEILLNGNQTVAATSSEEKKVDIKIPKIEQI